jgi:hypothetical protein
MQQKQQNNDPFGLFSTLLLAYKLKKNIFLISIIASLLFLLAFLMIDDQYTSSSVLKLRNQESSPAISSSPFGDLSAIARGDSFSMSSKQDIGYLHGLLNSRSFYSEKILSNKTILPMIIAFSSYDKANQINVYDNDLYNSEEEKWLGQYEQLNDQDFFNPLGVNSFYVFYDLLNYNFDKDTGLFTISVTHPSPIVAKDLLDTVVNSINIFMQEKQILEADKALNFLFQELEKNPPEQVQIGISSLIYKNLNKKMLASIDEESYFFEIIDQSFLPTAKSGPDRLFFTLIFFILIVLSQLILLAIYLAFKSDYAQFNSDR